jgi:hypothetical protein
MAGVMGRGTARRTPFTHGGPKIIIALDGDLSAAVSAEVQEALERILSALRAETGDDVEVEYVAASSLADPNTEADFWFGVAPTARPGFTLLFVSGMQQVFEQSDSTGAIYRDDVEVWPEAPVSMAMPTEGVVGELQLLRDGALLFYRPSDGHMRITTIPTITGLYSLPKLQPGWDQHEQAWIDTARQALARRLN